MTMWMNERMNEALSERCFEMWLAQFVKLRLLEEEAFLLDEK